MKFKQVLFFVMAAALSGCALMQPGSMSQQEMTAQARQALADLVVKNPAAWAVAHQSIAVLVFPSVLKGGFIFGAQTGNGVLFQNGMVMGYYNTTAVSYGLQAGLQDYGYALFFMNQNALSYLNKSGGFEVGAGPSLVIADEGFAKSFSTTTLTQDVYAFSFNQKGLMGGIGVAGSKITRLSP